MQRVALYLLLLGGILFTPLKIEEFKSKPVQIAQKVPIKVNILQEPKPVPKVTPPPKPREQPKPKPVQPKPKPKPLPKKQEPIKQEPTPQPILEEPIAPEETPQIEEPLIQESKPQEIQEVTQAPPPDPKIKEDYFSHIYTAIEANKKYPPKARRFRHEGDIRVNFIVQRDGTIKEFKILQETPYNTLNDAVTKMFERLRFERVPNELEAPLDFTITINFNLK